MRIFAIGDIHGGLRALKQLLERIEPQKEDRFIFMGDYVDGWSESSQVIDFLINMQNEFRCIFIKGNHDVWCENWLYTGKVEEKWYQHGGKVTMESYQHFTQKEKNVHLEFFERMKMYYVYDENRLFIHAGFTSMHGPEHEIHPSMYNWDRTLWELALCMDKRIQKNSELFPKRLKLYYEIFIGHTPTLNYKVDVPMQGCNVWNVDTGAAFFGKLSALEINTKTVFQSDTLQSLYPNEKGRN